ncbi:T9SS type A sorting domain-containing protein [Spirosoma flavum]|uniref:T9SS type A sorting domain-containing protein n=1 Tax=Spirosoma flavum TaxID=2048557 RepID=A0ABW6ACZ3_9BACT
MDNRLRTRCSSFLHNSKVFLICICVFIGLAVPAWAKNIVPTHAPTVLTVSVSSASVCAGTKTDLTASGCPANGSVRWSTTQTGTTITVVPVQTTTYTAICEVTSTTATSTTGIITVVGTATGTVQVYTPIILSPTSLSTLCNGSKDGQVAINAIGGTGLLQYQFEGQGFQTKNTTFGNLVAGTYTVAVKDALGCTVQATVDVKQPPALVAVITPIASKCTGGTDGALIAVASGGVGDYRYFLDYGTPQLTGTFINLKSNTTYIVAITDKNSCIFSQPVPIGSPTGFDIKVATKPTRCAGSADGSVTIAAAGGVGAYQYQLGTGAFQTGAQFTGLAANSYEVIVKDGNGCQGKQTVVVGQPAKLQLTTAAVPVNCFGPTSGSITVTPTGGTGTVQYQLATSKTPQSSNVFMGLTVGEYTIIGTDANVCTSLVSVTIVKAEPLKVQAVSTAATCCVCPTGAVKLTTTGGTGTGRQYQVIGQPYQENSQINGLRPNTYRFRVTDEVGCTDSIAAVVTDGMALTLSTGKIKDATCSGGKDGEATVQIAGGTKPFVYYWATERQDTLKPLSATQTTLSEGTYTVSVVDSNRCSTTTVFVSIKAQFPAPFKPTITQTGSSTLVVDQAAGIQWYVRTSSSPGHPVTNATGSTLVPFESGQYYAIVTNATGCSSPPSDAINFILTALAEPFSVLSVRVLPNPVIDRLRVEIEQVERSALTFQLLDASGRAVRQYELPAFTGKKQAEWALSGVATGSYLLKVNAESRQSLIRVLVE